jgi:hypothetical protein
MMGTPLDLNVHGAGAAEEVLKTSREMIWRFESVFERQCKR